MYDDLAGSGDLLRERAPDDDAGAIRFRRERDLGDVVNVTFRFLRDNRRELGYGLLVIVGPVALGAAFLSAWAGLQMEQGMTEPFDPVNPFALPPGYWRWIALTALVAVLTQLLMQAVLLGYVERYRRGEAGTITPARLWEATKAALGPVATTTLLVLVLAPLTVVVAIVPILGFLVWLVGVVYLLPIIALLYVERVATRDGFWEGLAATRELIRGHWWQMFGVFVVVMLLVFVIALLLSIPGGVVEAAFAFNTIEGGGALRVVALAVSALFGVFVYAAYAIPTVAYVFQYFNLVERKEGAGLQADLAALRASARVLPVEAPAPSPRAWQPDPEPPSERGFRGGGFDDEPGHAG